MKNGRACGGIAHPATHRDIDRKRGSASSSESKAAIVAAEPWAHDAGSLPSHAPASSQRQSQRFDEGLYWSCMLIACGVDVERWNLERTESWRESHAECSATGRQDRSISQMETEERAGDWTDEGDEPGTLHRRRCERRKHQRWRRRAKERGRRG